MKLINLFIIDEEVKILCFKTKEKISKMNKKGNRLHVSATYRER